MYMHEEIILAVLPVLHKSSSESEKMGEYPMSLQDFIGELNHAAWVISTHNDTNINELLDKLRGRELAEGKIK